MLYFYYATFKQTTDSIKKELVIYNVINEDINDPLKEKLDFKLINSVVLIKVSLSQSLSRDKFYFTSLILRRDNSLCDIFGLPIIF